MNLLSSLCNTPPPFFIHLIFSYDSYSESHMTICQFDIFLPLLCCNKRWAATNPRHQWLFAQFPVSLPLFARLFSYRVCSSVKPSDQIHGCNWAFPADRHTLPVHAQMIFIETQKWTNPQKDVLTQLPLFLFFLFRAKEAQGHSLFLIDRISWRFPCLRNPLPSHKIKEAHKLCTERLSSLCWSWTWDEGAECYGHH